jgi:hypothetical protein
MVRDDGRNQVFWYVDNRNGDTPEQKAVGDLAVKAGIKEIAIWHYARAGDIPLDKVRDLLEDWIELFAYVDYTSDVRTVAALSGRTIDDVYAFVHRFPELYSETYGTRLLTLKGTFMFIRDFGRNEAIRQAVKDVIIALKATLQ